MPDPQDTTLSRSGASNAGGKLTARIDVPVPEEEPRKAIVALATIEGISMAEWVFMLRRIVHQAGPGQSDESRTDRG